MRAHTYAHINTHINIYTSYYLHLDGLPHHAVSVWPEQSFSCMLPLDLNTQISNHKRMHTHMYTCTHACTLARTQAIAHACKHTHTHVFLPSASRPCLASSEHVVEVIFLEPAPRPEVVAKQTEMHASMHVRTCTMYTHHVNTHTTTIHTSYYLHLDGLPHHAVSVWPEQSFSCMPDDLPLDLNWCFLFMKRDNIMTNTIPYNGISKIVK